MAEISLTRLTGGNTPADGSDPRTFPAIWNASATAIEDAIAEGGGGSITVSETAPTDPAPGQGDLWWDSVNGKLFVYYVDGDSSQWVDAAGPSVAVQSSAPTGYEGQLWLDDTDGSMYVYYTDPGGANSQWIGAVSRSGGILQVVQAVKTDTFSSTSTSLTDVTGLTASITPSSTSSKILVLTSVTHGSSANIRTLITLADGSNNNLVTPDSPGSRTPVFVGFETNQTANLMNANFSLLHSPSTTSTFTYKIRAATQSGTVYINRDGNGADSSSIGRGVSTITLIEVAG